MIINPEYDCIETLAKEILVAARTAPKGRGQDNIITALLEKREQDILAKAMEDIADARGESHSFFKRDAKNIRYAGAVILLGLIEASASGLNCGACGFENCDAMLQTEKIKVNYTGPQCSIKFIDLGIALGAAVSKAKDFCVDNRIFYSAGAAAIETEIIKADVALAIPLSITGKNIFFDRTWP